MAAVERNPTIVGVVLTGAGRGFCADAGVGDLEERVEESLEEYSSPLGVSDGCCPN